MKVKIKLFAPFTELFKADKGEVELTNVYNLHELLDSLCDSKECRGKIFDDSGELRPYVTILINGQPIKKLNGVHTELNDGDEIAIFPPIAGG